MTLREVANQIINLAVEKNINHETYTENRLFQELKERLQTNECCFLTVRLQDGEWLVEVFKVHVGYKTLYDYAIPDTREHEAEIKAWLEISQQ